MKRLISALALFAALSILALTLVGCSTCEHRDADDNNICEKCGQEFSDADDTGSAANGGALSYAASTSTPDTYIITGIGSATAKDIVIPESIGGVPVSAIAEGAFKDCAELTSVSVPKSVTSIGKGAFSGCVGLKKITLPFVGSSNIITNNTYFGFIFGGSGYKNNAAVVPEGLKSVELVGGVRIDSRAFEGCEGIMSISLPDELVSIGSSAFYGCTNITSITIPSAVTTISSSAFLDCFKLVEVVNNSSLKLSAGSSSNGHVAYYAKEVHSAATKCEIIDGLVFYAQGGQNYLVGYVGDDAQITLPENYNGESYKIYKYAFYKNRVLASVGFSSGVTEIGDSAFLGCSALRELAVGGAVESIGRSAFADCESLRAIEISDSVRSIGGGAFSRCKALEAVNISDISAWLKIAFDAPSANPLYFAGRLYLGGTLVTELVIPDSIEIIEEYAMVRCTSLKKVTIHDGVTEIGREAFAGCIGITDMFVPDSVAIIGKAIFNGCNGIVNLSIPYIGASIDDESNNYFGYYFNSSDSGNYNDNVPESIKHVVVRGGSFVATSTFYNCSAIAEITLPNGITSIGSYAFFGCSSLERVNIPQSVLEMGGYVFSGCESLCEIYYGADEEAWLAFGTTHGAPTDVVYFFSVNEPAAPGRYWHYVGEAPTKW